MTNPLGTSMVIDSHLHLWNVERPDRPYPWTPDPHPVESLVPVLDAAGIARAVQVTPSIMGYDNEYGLEVAAADPERFSVFGRFDHRRVDALDGLTEWMGRPGASGIRLTFFGPTAARPGELQRYVALWEACAELSVPVAVFAPDVLPDLVEVAQTYPTLRLVVDHLGLAVFEGSPDPFSGWHHLPSLAATPNITMKISTLVESSREPYPFADVHDHLAEAVELFGVRRLAWGSNYPVVLSACSYAESLTFLASCPFLDAEDLEWLTHRTWAAFVGG